MHTSSESVGLLRGEPAKPSIVSVGDALNYFKNRRMSNSVVVIASIAVAILGLTNSSDDAPISVTEGMISFVILVALCAIAFYGVEVVSRDPSPSTTTASSYFPAVWAIAPFYFSIVGSGQGVFIEGYLIATGKVLQADLVPAAAAFRAGIAMLIMNVSTLSDAFMVFGNGEHTILLTYISYFLIIIGSFAGASVFYSDLHGDGEIGDGGIGKQFGGLTTVGLTFVSFLTISFHGCAYGGRKAQIMLALSKLTTVVGLLAFPPPNSVNTMIYHSIRIVGVYLSIVPFHLANIESPGFAHKAESGIPPSTIVLLVLCGIFAWVAGANAF